MNAWIKLLAESKLNLKDGESRNHQVLACPTQERPSFDIKLEATRLTHTTINPLASRQIPRLKSRL